MNIRGRGSWWWTTESSRANACSTFSRLRVEQCPTMRRERGSNFVTNKCCRDRANTWKHTAKDYCIYKLRPLMFHILLVLYSPRWQFWVVVSVRDALLASLSLVDALHRALHSNKWISNEFLYNCTLSSIQQYVFAIRLCMLFEFIRSIYSCKFYLYCMCCNYRM